MTVGAHVARTGLGLLRLKLILPRLVTCLGIDEFRGAENDTVNVRLSARLVARGVRVAHAHRTVALPSIRIPPSPTRYSPSDHGLEPR